MQKQDKTKLSTKNTELYPCWSFTIYVPSLIPRQLVLIVNLVNFQAFLIYLQFIQTVSDQKMGAGKIWEDEARCYVGILVSLLNMRQPSLIPRPAQD